MGRYFRLVIYFQLVIILSAGLLVVFNFSGKTNIWSPIDEAAHFSYIQYIAQEHRLPILLKDFMQIEITSISEKTYPNLSKSNPINLGLAGWSYEAFQPPFYYIMASPVFYFSNNFVYKIYSIRFFNWLILLFSLYILYKLVRLLFENDYIRPLAFAYNLFLFPSIIIRHIIISNDVLSIPLVLSFFYFVVKFDKSIKLKYLFSASFAVSIAILTKLLLGYLVLFFILYLMYSIFYKRHEYRIIDLVLVFAIPILFTSPWFYSNIVHYGGLTGHTLVKELMMGIINPKRVDYGLITFWNQILHLISGTFMASEVGIYYLSVFYLCLTALLQSLIFFLPFLFLVLHIKSYKYYIFYCFPFFLNMAGLIYITVFENFAIEARYLYGSLPLWYVTVFLIYNKILVKPALDQLTLIIFFAAIIFLMNSHLI